MTISPLRAEPAPMPQTGRNYPNWLSAYCDYASYSEAPRHMHFWSGVAAVAGAMRRRVWVDMGYFRWFANFYIILVAPPGIVAKSTTAGIAMALLRRVPGIKFGPDIVTWPKLVGCFAEAKEAFQYREEWHSMCAMTLESSEFGNLINTYDTQQINLMISLWDGKQGNFEKETKHSGSDSVENPWINLIACTTPSWIAENVPEQMISGGFVSRCIFVYADKKEKLVAYPKESIPAGMREAENRLVEDLIDISTSLCGEYELTPEAKRWGIEWYGQHYARRPAHLDDARFGGYLARKQTHIHKLAMVLAAAESNNLSITAEHLNLANVMTTDLETDMAKVFSQIGKTEISLNVDRFVSLIHKHPQGIAYGEVYRFVHAQFPSMREFDDVVQGSIRAGLIKMAVSGTTVKFFPGDSAKL